MLVRHMMARTNPYERAVALCLENPNKPIPSHLGMDIVTPVRKKTEDFYNLGRTAGYFALSAKAASKSAHDEFKQELDKIVAEVFYPAPKDGLTSQQLLIRLWGADTVLDKEGRGEWPDRYENEHKHFLRTAYRMGEEQGRKEAAEEVAFRETKPLRWTDVTSRIRADREVRSRPSGPPRAPAVRPKSDDDFMRDFKRQQKRDDEKRRAERDKDPKKNPYGETMFINPKPIMSYEEWFLATERAVRNNDAVSLKALRFAMDIGAVAEPRPKRAKRGKGEAANNPYYGWDI